VRRLALERGAWAAESTTYTVTVQATNAAGSSAASGSAQTTTFAAPGLPTSFLALPNTGGADLSWERALERRRERHHGLPPARLQRQNPPQHDLGQLHERELQLLASAASPAASAIRSPSTRSTP
jgi:hypothetical protein